MVGKALLKKLIILRVLETYGESDKNTIRLPRQGIPFRLRPLYLLDFREIRAGIWDTFGTVEDCDIAQNSRYRLLMKESAPAVCKSIY